MVDNSKKAEDTNCCSSCHCGKVHPSQCGRYARYVVINDRVAAKRLPIISSPDFSLSPAFPANPQHVGVFAKCQPLSGTSLRIPRIHLASIRLHPSSCAHTMRWKRYQPTSVRRQTGNPRRARLSNGIGSTRRARSAIGESSDCPPLQ